VVALVLAAALVAPVHVQGHAAIGGYRIKNGSFAGAVKVFGKPLAQRQEKGGCAVRWRGLQIRFYTLFRTQQCRPDSSFESASVTGAWIAGHGLRRGDTLARVRTLYPHTRKATVLGRSAYWLDRSFSQAIGDYGLAVAVRNGRAADLIVLDPQGGE
jgi:hypothetical protein